MRGDKRTVESQNLRNPSKFVKRIILEKNRGSKGGTENRVVDKGNDAK